MGLRPGSRNPQRNLDYGWLEEVKYEKDNPRRDLFLCFFHQRIWDEVVAFEKRKNENENPKFRVDWKQIWKPMSLHSEEIEFPEFAEEFYHVARFADGIRRDILSGPRWRGHQDWDNDERRELIHRLEIEMQAGWRFAGDEDEKKNGALLDRYGLYYLDDEDDPESKIPPEIPTFSEQIADVLRTEDKYGWKEALNIHEYTVFELLRKVQPVLRAIEIEQKK